MWICGFAPNHLQKLWPMKIGFCRLPDQKQGPDQPSIGSDVDEVEVRARGRGVGWPQVVKLLMALACGLTILQSWKALFEQDCFHTRVRSIHLHSLGFGLQAISWPSTKALLAERYSLGRGAYATSASSSDRNHLILNLFQPNVPGSVSQTADVRAPIADIWTCLNENDQIEQNNLWEIHVASSTWRWGPSHLRLCTSIPSSYPLTKTKLRQASDAGKGGGFWAFAWRDVHLH